MIIAVQASDPGRGHAYATSLAASCARHGAADAELVVVAPGASVPIEAARVVAAADPDDVPRIDRLARTVLGQRVGIALGAGGTRGFAHVGVLETLAAHGIPIDCIAGTSIGAVIGSLWAFGHPPDEIMAMCGETRRHYLRWTVPLRSLLSNRGIAAHIERSAAGRTFEASPIPLGVVAADLCTGERVLLRTGKLAPAILASSSIPGVFPAVPDGARRLVDGGICEPVPVHSCVELGADRVIAVSLGGSGAVGGSGGSGAGVGERTRSRSYGVIAALVRSSAIVQARAHDHCAALADVVIAPAAPARGRWIDFDRAEELRAAGRVAALAALPALHRALPWLGTRVAA